MPTSDPRFSRLLALVRPLFLTLPIMIATTLSAAPVTFLADLEMDNLGNTSGLMPYFTTPSATPHSAGVPNESPSGYSDRFFFRDVSTGIDFAFNYTWEAETARVVGTNLLGTNTNVMGVDNAAMNTNETMTVRLSGLNVDLSNYIVGSVGGIMNPTLNSSSIAFSQLNFGSFNGNGNNTTVLGITGNVGIGGDTFYRMSENGTAGIFEVGVEGLSDMETQLTFTVLSGQSSDPNYNFESSQMRVALDVSESAVAVPEPSSFAIFGISMLALASRNRKTKLGKVQ